MNNYIYTIDFGNKRTFDDIKTAKAFANDNNITNYKIYKSINEDVTFYILEW